MPLRAVGHIELERRLVQPDAQARPHGRAEPILLRRRLGRAHDIALRDRRAAQDEPHRHRRGLAQQLRAADLGPRQGDGNRRHAVLRRGLRWPQKNIRRRQHRIVGARDEYRRLARVYRSTRDAERSRDQLDGRRAGRTNIHRVQPCLPATE